MVKVIISIQKEIIVFLLKVIKVFALRYFFFASNIFYKYKYVGLVLFHKIDKTVPQKKKLNVCVTLYFI